MQLLYAVGVLLLINVQVNSIPTASFNQFEPGFDELFKEITEGLFNDFVELKSAKSLIQDGELEIESLFTTALLQLEEEQPKIGLECFQQSLQEFQILKKNSFSDFMKCDRLQEGLKNMGKLFGESFDVTVDLSADLKSFVKEWTKCEEGNKLKKALCVMKNIWNFMKKVKSLVPKFKEQGLDIKKMVKKLREIYKYCKNAQKLKVNDQVALVLAQSRLCAGNQ
uniref:Uncharacterized protein n=2 Tax=Rhodnius TaxID=13248 RepID=T1HJD2_RHOPR